jgi:hypothetical protein
MNDLKRKYTWFIRTAKIAKWSLPLKENALNRVQTLMNAMSTEHFIPVIVHLGKIGGSGIYNTSLSIKQFSVQN